MPIEPIAQEPMYSWQRPEPGLQMSEAGEVPKGNTFEIAVGQDKSVEESSQAKSSCRLDEGKTEGTLQGGAQRRRPDMPKHGLEAGPARNRDSHISSCEQENDSLCRQERDLATIRTLFEIPETNSMPRVARTNLTPYLAANPHKLSCYLAPSPSQQGTYSRTSSGHWTCKEKSRPPNAPSPARESSSPFRDILASERPWLPSSQTRSESEDEVLDDDSSASSGATTDSEHQLPEGGTRVSAKKTATFRPSTGSDTPSQACILPASSSAHSLLDNALQPLSRLVLDPEAGRYVLKDELVLTDGPDGPHRSSLIEQHKSSNATIRPSRDNDIPRSRSESLSGQQHPCMGQDPQPKTDSDADSNAATTPSQLGYGQAI